MIELMAGAVVIGGYIGWIWASVLHTWQKQAAHRYRNSLVMAEKELVEVREENRKSDVGIRVLKMQLRAAYRDIDALNRTIANRRMESERHDNELRATRDKLARMKRRQGQDKTCSVVDDQTDTSDAV